MKTRNLSLYSCISESPDGVLCTLPATALIRFFLDILPRPSGSIETRHCRDYTFPATARQTSLPGTLLERTSATLPNTIPYSADG